MEDRKSIGGGEAASTVSIIVSVLNGAHGLDACLRSCVEQDYSNKQLIVIDGGSTDGTLDIIHGFDRSISYWVSEPDDGIYHAWNKALRAASGEWVCFLGADDVWSDTQCLSRMMSLAHYPEVNVVCARIRKESYQGRKGYVFGEPWDYMKMKWRMTVGHAGMLHHMSLFREYGFFDETYRIAGDYAFLLRAGRSIRSAYLPETVVVMGGGGVSSTNLRTVQHEGRRALIESGRFGVVYGWIFFISFFLKNLLRIIVRNR